MLDFIREYAIAFIVAAAVCGFGLGLVTTGIIFSIRERPDGKEGE